MRRAEPGVPADTLRVQLNESLGIKSMNRWKVVGIVVEGEAINVAGVNPWQIDWQRVHSDPVELPHPQYPKQLHRMNVYKVQGDEKSVTFAAGELSANVWGFYVPDAQPVDQANVHEKP